VSESSQPSIAAPSNAIITTWSAPLRFDAVYGTGHSRVDCEGHDAPAPLDAVLQALSACAASDVVLILQKQRAVVTALRVGATAHRVTTTPRRFASIALHFEIEGRNLDRAKAERAIDLSLTRHCSVRESLNPEITVQWTVEVQSLGSAESQ